MPGYLHTIFQQVSVGQYVGLVRQLYQGVGILAGHGQRAARAVVFERAREQETTIGEQGTCDAITSKPLIRLAIEAEMKRLIAVDQQAHGSG